jgi:succinate dehydrogenase/fumarate reductase cytochrome b subunit
MSASTSIYTTAMFWERLWRLSGINFVVFFIIAYLIYGYQPPVGAAADALVAFYDGDRTRILIAAVISGLAVLNLLWFAAAIRATLADAGQDGWGAAATAASAAAAALFLLPITVVAALAYSIAGSGNQMLTSGLNDFRVGRRRADVVPARDAGHGERVRALAGRVDLERALRRRGRGCRARLAGRHHVAERWILGTGRRLFAVRLAHHRPRVGRGREPGPLGPKSRDATWMVMPAPARSRLWPSFETPASQAPQDEG